MAGTQPKPNVSFEETPRAQRTLPTELPPFDIDPDETATSNSKEFAPPTFDPFEYFGMETPKKPAKKSKMRIESDADSDIVILDNTAVATADARQATKRLLDDLTATFAPDFVMKASDIGTVRILDNSRYRGHFSAPPAKRYLPTKNHDDGADLLTGIINAGHTWIYVSVYEQPNPTEDDATHLAKALETLEKTNLTDVIAENYIPNALKKGGKGPNTLILACKTKEAEEAILHLTGLSYNLKEDAQQWGNVVQITIGNAKDDMTDILRTVAQKLHPFIEWDKNDKSDRWPTYLAIAPIPDAPVHQGGLQGRAQTTWVPFRQPGEPHNWHVTFTYDRTQINKLQIPEIAGQWAWGSVTMALTDFCQACCSWGHTTAQCGWWEVPGVQVRAKRPQNSNELEWTVVEALHPQTGQPLKREQKKQPSREPTLTPSLPEPPTKGKGKGRGRPRKSLGPPQPSRRK
ncbi:hypothetical protein FRB99_007909 [Tulasnella sp. 403]|nr:hypothetical protein FRB99_007909 [Tulasnella sp. 403]